MTQPENLSMEISLFPGYHVYSDGSIYSEGAGRMMKGTELKGGLYVCLGGKTFRRDYVVMAHFGPRQPGCNHRIVHIDGDQTNCCIDNLEWRMSIDYGKRSGEHNSHAKLMAHEVAIMRMLYTGGTHVSDIHRYVCPHVTKRHVSRICRGHMWNNEYSECAKSCS